MEYELIKDFSGWKKGEVYNLWGRIIVGTSTEELEHLWIVKKVEEKKKPKFKVGDYAVHMRTGWMMKISDICEINGEYRYSGIDWKYLRTPNKEELELYFR